MPIPGIVTFTIKGQEHKLEPVAEAGDRAVLVHLPRSDESEGNISRCPVPVRAGRPSNGRMILDFNKAQNPPCAYNPYTTCPLPTEQNRLRMRIEAGEMRYEGHS